MKFIFPLTTTNLIDSPRKMSIMFCRITTLKYFLKFFLTAKTLLISSTTYYDKDLMPQSLVSLLGPEQIPHTQVLFLTFLPPPQDNVQLLYSLYKDQATSSVAPELILNDYLITRIFTLRTLPVSWLKYFCLPAATIIYDAKDS